MSTAAPLQNTAAKSPPVSKSSHAGLLLQRKCACGVPVVSSFTGKCGACEKNRLQAKLTIGASNDPLEQEADRVADQVLAAPAHSAVRGAKPSIQRFMGQATGNVGTAPPSVDRVLSGSGKPLDPVLQNDMWQHFGHDFSQVRVHTGASAEESARDLNASAYVIANNIVFGANQFAPETPRGRHLLAHELTHVVQQQEMISSTPSVMLRGRTAGGFFSNIFHFWDYSKETLDSYLLTLDRDNQIQGDDDSDDMARQIVTEWKHDKTKYDLQPKVKVLLVREMLDGIVSTADQESMMDLLDGSRSTDLREMFKNLTYEEIHSRFTSLKPRLEFFKIHILDNLEKYKAPAPNNAKSIEKGLDDASAPLGIDFTDVSISFRISPGNLMESFKVNLTVPEGGVQVTITLTRTSLVVRIEPSILIDVVWPLSNAHLNGFSLTFAGLKPKLDIEGNELVSNTAQAKMEEYLKGLLAGTRFEEPKYDPVKDTHLISELTDRDETGDINRVRYNFEKNKTGGSDSKMGIQGLSSFAIYLNLVHKAGLPIPTKGYGIVIPPGTGFGLQIYTSGSAAELMKKNVRLDKIRIVSTGIFLYKGPTKIAGLRSIEMQRDFKITLGNIESFVDIGALANEESKGKWYEGVVGAATSILPNATLTDIVAWYAEGELRGRVRQVVEEHRKKIISTLGITDKQLDEFFGVENN